MIEKEIYELIDLIRKDLSIPNEKEVTDTFIMLQSYQDEISINLLSI